MRAVAALAEDALISRLPGWHVRAAMPGPQRLCRTHCNNQWHDGLLANTRPCSSAYHIPPPARLCRRLVSREHCAKGCQGPALATSRRVSSLGKRRQDGGASPLPADKSEAQVRGCLWELKPCCRWQGSWPPPPLVGLLPLVLLGCCHHPGPMHVHMCCTASDLPATKSTLLTSHDSTPSWRSTPS